MEAGRTNFLPLAVVGIGDTGQTGHMETSMIDLSALRTAIVNAIRAAASGDAISSHVVNLDSELQTLEAHVNTLDGRVSALEGKAPADDSEATDALMLLEAAAEAETAPSSQPEAASTPEASAPVAEEPAPVEAAPAAPVEDVAGDPPGLANAPSATDVPPPENTSPGDAPVPTDDTPPTT